MLEFLFADHVIPFTISLILFLLIAAVETICLFFGVQISGWFGIDVNMDGNADIGGDVGVDGASGVDIGHEGVFTHFYSWLRVGQVPLLILLVVFLASYGTIGLTLQYAVLSLFGGMLNVFLAAIAAFLLALPMVRMFSGLLNRIIPKDETVAVSLDSLIGRIAVISLGVAKSHYPAQARVVDHFGNIHYVMLEPDNADAVIGAGEKALLVRREDGHFFGIKVTEPIEELGERGRYHSTES